MSAPHSHARRLAAADALLTARRVRDAATVAAINEKTLRGWLRQPQFVTVLEDVARDRRSHALRMLGNAQAEAIAALVGVLRGGDPNAIVKAAQTLLEHGMETLLVDVAQRVARLEQDATRAQ